MAEQETSKSRRTRLSLTRAQREAGVGAELLVLCETLTEDGVISEREANELAAWLNANSGSDLPAVEFLSTLVRRILDDGKVTPEEQRELYQAIERILPPEARKQAQSRRKAQESAEREVNHPTYFANFMVAGVHYEGRPLVIRQYAKVDDTVFLVRERDNRYSPKAIEVRLHNGFGIGYVPESHAVEMAPLLDSGHRHRAYITKILTGGRVPIPVVQAYMYRPEATVDKAVLETAVPERRAAGPAIGTAAPRGCGLRVVLFVLAGFVTLLWLLLR